MRIIPVVVLITLLFVCTSTATERQARFLDVQSQITAPGSNLNLRDDDLDKDTLAYGAWDSLKYYWVIPAPEGPLDIYYNVRFTPNPEPANIPVNILGALIPLYDLKGNHGTPGMTVLVWSSGEIAREPGYPAELIDSIIIPYEDLVFSSYVDKQLILKMNYIDLSGLKISFAGAADFHIGVDLVDNTGSDQLSVFSDSGDPEYATDRSGIWDGEGHAWKKMRDIEYDKVKRPFNLAIKAVVSYGKVGVPTVLEPSARQPQTVSIASCYPNPFNSQTHLNYSVLPGVPFTVKLLNQSGQTVRQLEQGIGTGTHSLIFNGLGIPSGGYLLVVQAGQGSAVSKIMYLK